MIDERFYRRAGPFSLAQVAEYVNGTLEPATMADLLVTDIAVLEQAGPTDLGVFSDARYRRVCCDSRAAAIVTDRKLAEGLPSRPLVVVAAPRLAYAMICRLFHPVHPVEAYLSPEAHIDPSATIGEGCRIEAGAGIGAGAVLGPRCRIDRGAVISDGVRIAEDCHIGANAVVSHADLGARVFVAAGGAIGGAGFGFVPAQGGLMRVPQLGRVVVGDDVEIGNNCTIDRGALSDTVIGAGTKIDNLVHIAHNVKIGRFCIITAQVGIAGSASIGDGTMIGGQAAIADHVTVGAQVKIVPQSGIIRDIPDGEIVGGSPALPVRDWHRQTVALAKLAGCRLRPPARE
jgi:UDP-3-O-[3-hydroxymyristoyl] glucosamine N-acyltransferase